MVGGKTRTLINDLKVNVLAVLKNPTLIDMSA